MSQTTEFIQEPSREIPVAAQADLCVIGGSCTGLFAAVRAARLGARVALVENQGFFGGTATAGMVSIWHSAHDWEVTRQVVGGLSMEVIERLQRRRAVDVVYPPTCFRGFILNTEELKIELDELAVESGVIPFLHTRFVAPVMSGGGRIEAIIVEDKTGRRAIRAHQFIDASGDGDLLARAGFPFRTSSSPQPPTTVAIFDHYMEIRRRNPEFDLRAEVHDPRHPDALTQGFLWGAPVPGRPEAYMVAGSRAHGADCADADQLTQAEIECRRQVRTIGDILRREVPGAENLTLANLAACIGVRETRHAECLHRVTRDELLLGTDFPDTIGRGTYCLDVHHSDRPGITMMFLDGTQSYHAPGQINETTRWRPESEGVTPFYRIPYRALVPQGSVNLLVAGRLIDADPSAYGALRVMMNCNQMGEATGVAAVLAQRENLTVDQVPIQSLRQTLIEGGSILD